MIKIQSARLQVEIASPGEEYCGSRFDWTGFITQIILDGKHSFCTVESETPGQGCGGQGLCGEFGITDPVGFEEAEPGSMFPKLGVGLLKRPDNQPYSFFRPYEVTPFDFKVKCAADSANFVVEPMECNGYAASIEKKISVCENRLEISCSLDNVGSKPLRTNEYNHNFISINRRPVGPEYRFSAGFSLKNGKLPLVLQEEGDRNLAWLDHPSSAFYYSMTPAEASISQWELIHCPSGVGVRERSTFPIAIFALWGVGHVVSPETFFGIELSPGQQANWTRAYEFFN